MKLEELFHTIRALHQQLPNEQIIVIGSQSLYGQLKEQAIHIKHVEISKETDIIMNNTMLNNQINFDLGELSQFDQTFGYYVDAVFEKNIYLPKNFKNRLVNCITNDNIKIQMLNVNDYIVCKLFVGREKDLTLLEELSELTKKNNSNYKIDFERMEKIIEEYPENNKEKIQIVKERLFKYFKHIKKIKQRNIKQPS